MAVSGLESSWVPWVVKQGRPTSVLGHQNTESLPHLPDGAINCGESSQCFYYKCKKCIRDIIFGTLITADTETELVFIPEVKFIQPQSKYALFKMDPGYHGEVAEVFAGYLSRMENLTGVAINGWSNKEAAKIFTNVEKTFMGTKHEVMEDFEIDWLIFSGNNLFVFEVGMRDDEKLDDEKGNEHLISMKCSQAAKDEMVIRHLIEATDFSPDHVYYVAVFPNLPFEDIEKKLRRVREQRESLNRLVSPEKSLGGVRFHFGVITSDVISEKSIYLYINRDEASVEKAKHFEEPKRFESLLEPTTSKIQKYAISVVAASKLLTAKIDKGKKKVKNSDHIHLEPPSNNWNWADKWQKKDAKNLVKYPNDAPRNKEGQLIKFPVELILGPDQIKAVTSQKKHTIIIGEAGSGKTTVLLAVLYKYTGKHLIGKKANFKKVHFLIPESKIELRKYVQSFIDKNCEKQWAQLGSPEIIERRSICSENIYLIDEFYAQGNNFFEFPCWANIWLSHTSFDSHRASDPIIYPTTKKSARQVLYFRRLYRSPPMVSKVCAKLSRRLDQKSEDSVGDFSRIPWAMSRFDRIGFTSESPIKIEKFDDKITLNICKDKTKERETLIVCWKLNTKLQQQLKDQQADATFYSLKSCSITVHDLSFTGSEFQNVVLVLGERVNPNSKSGLILLYNTISRSTEKVYMFCHSNHFDQVKLLLELSDSDVIFDKLRTGDKLGKRLFGDAKDKLLSATSDRVEAFKRACVMGKTAQSNAIVDFKSELRDVNPVIEAIIPGQSEEVAVEKLQKSGGNENLKTTCCDSGLSESSETKTEVAAKTDSRVPDCTKVVETQNDANTKNDRDYNTPNGNGTILEEKIETACQVDGLTHCKKTNNEMINLFDPENKDFWQFINICSNHLTNNPDEMSSFLQMASSSVEQWSSKPYAGFPNVQTAVRIGEEERNTENSRAEMAALFPLVHNMSSMLDGLISSEMKSTMIQIASSIAVGNDCRDDWKTFSKRMVDQHCTDDSSKTSWYNFFNGIFDLMRQTSNSEPRSRIEQTKIEIICAIEYLNDEEALIEFLQKRQISVTDRHFKFILCRVFLTKSDHFFANWVQHLIQNESVQFSDEWWDSNEINLLTLCARSTEHFKKVIKLVDDNERLVLLYQKDSYGHNCFMKACICDNLEVVQILVKDYQYDWMSSTDSEGNSIINILAETSNVRILKYLFAEICDPDRNKALESWRILNDEGWSFLSQICSEGNYDLLQFFIEKTNWPSLQQIFPFPRYGRHYIDCLLLALKSRKQNIFLNRDLMEFVKEGIKKNDLKLDDSSLRGSSGGNILMASVYSPETLKYFLDLAEKQSLQSALLCQKDSSENSCLRLACIYGKLDSVKLLMGYNQIDWKSGTYYHGKTLLHDLFDFGLSQIVEHLYQNFFGEFVKLAKVLDSHGKSCLYYACSAAKSVECVTVLIKILDTILPLPDNLSDFMDCILAAKESDSDCNDEILELLIQCFNNKMCTNFGGDLEDVFKFYRDKTADVDLD